MARSSASRAAPEAADDGGSARETLFDAGRNCWRVAHAERVGLLVDGDEYYTAFYEAAQRARSSLLILGWDFNSRTRLLCDDPPPGAAPGVLGDFLNFLARRTRGLDVRILIWDYPMIFGVDREFPSGYGIGWKPHRRIRVRYDNTHPVGASHHQKIVVIDDAVAFCGGIDLTSRRWDTHDHRPEDERRCHEGAAYPPFHDAMMMVDGAAARALGEVARERWRAATSRRLHAPRRAAAAAWPDDVPVAVRDVDVAISRTVPPGDGDDGVHEVEALYVDMIGAARRSIYVENQYFTSDVVGKALATRLAEPDGPEVIVVLRLLSHGWLEELTMQNLRKALIERLRAADARGRLRVYYPSIDGLADDACIDVHSKVLVVDEDWLRIGSANVCNRSMGLDTECDVTIEARGREEVRDAIAHFRERLLGEHMGVEPARVREAVQEHGSIRDAIDALRAPGRTLEPLAHEPVGSDALMAVAGLADLEAPVTMEGLVQQFAPRTRGGGHAGGLWIKVAAVAVVVAGLTAMWRYTPLAEWITAERIVGWARQFAGAPWAPFAVILAYTPASIVMFPRPLITLFAVVAFDAWLGFGYAMTGILLAALLSYVAGMRFDRTTVRRMSGENLERVVRVMRRRGLVAMTALRLVPLAPFAVEGIIAGAIRIRFFDFMAGTFLGMLPGTLAATVFGDQLTAALRDPSALNPWLLAGIALGLVAATLYVRRWLLTTESSGDAAPRAGA
jgi:phospholipase D1/2